MELEIIHEDISSSDVFDFSSYDEKGFKTIGNLKLDKELAYEVYHYLNEKDQDSLCLDDNGNLLKNETIAYNILKYYNKI